LNGDQYLEIQQRTRNCKIHGKDKICCEKGQSDVDQSSSDSTTIKTPPNTRATTKTTRTTITTTKRTTQTFRTTKPTTKLSITTKTTTKPLTTNTVKGIKPTVSTKTSYADLTQHPNFKFFKNLKCGIITSGNRVAYGKNILNLL
jgi:hypothetical protein